MTDAPGNESHPSTPLTAAQARQLLTVGDPNYGRGFSDAEWEQIAERLSALTRLVCRMHAWCQHESPRQTALTRGEDNLKTEPMQPAVE